MNPSALAIHAVVDNPLAKLELARRLLAETRSVDEVKMIRNLGEAARVYARQARLGLEAQNDAAEIKLRAERRLGELIATLPKQDGGDAARARSQAATEVPPRLDDLGISKSQSSRCQTIAAVPEPVFEEYVTGVREQGRVDGKTELTTTGALLVARQYRPSSSSNPAAHDQPPEQSDMRHRFDVADAAALPWPDSSVDLVVTSPPYGLGVNYQDADDSDYAGLARQAGDLVGRVVPRRAACIGPTLPERTARSRPRRLAARIRRRHQRRQGSRLAVPHLAALGQASGRSGHGSRQYRFRRGSQRDGARRVGAGLLPRLLVPIRPGRDAAPVVA